MPGNAAAAVEELYRSDWGRIVATLIGLVGDFDLAEEAAQEAFAAAVDQWPIGRRAGVSAGVDHSDGAAQSHRPDPASRALRGEAGIVREERAGARGGGAGVRYRFDNDEIPDDRLRLIFTCCHPALAPEAQVALTLRTLCGLETDEIARAFLVPETDHGAALVRAKRKIRDAGIPYAVPEARRIGERLDAVLTVIYLVFNEGYAATRGGPLVRTDLCAEAIRLARLVRALTRPDTAGRSHRRCWR